MKKSTNKKLKALWCVDVLSKNMSLERHATTFLKALGKGLQLEIHPVFIENDLFYKAGPLHDKAKKNFQSFVERSQKIGLKKPKLLSNITSAYSVRDQVNTLLEYAKKGRFQLIITHTSNRKGLAKFFLGSFAETLMLKSQTPLLILNPKSRSTNKIQRVLYPTDLSQESKKGFKKVLELCQLWGAHVTLYHKLMDPPKIFDKKQMDHFAHQNRLENWIQMALKYQVKMKIKIEKNTSSISKAINDTSKKEKAQLIAMVTRSGELETLMVGSSARNVMREAQLPIWIVHS